MLNIVQSLNPLQHGNHVSFGAAITNVWINSKVFTAGSLRQNCCSNTSKSADFYNCAAEGFRCLNTINQQLHLRLSYSGLIKCKIRAFLNSSINCQLANLVT